MTNRTPQQIVEEVCRHWPSTGCPTDGYLRESLRALGIDPRGMNRDTMLREARRAGLPFKDKAEEHRR